MQSACCFLPLFYATNRGFVKASGSTGRCCCEALGVKLGRGKMIQVDELLGSWEERRVAFWSEGLLTYCFFWSKKELISGRSFFSFFFVTGGLFGSKSGWVHSS